MMRYELRVRDKRGDLPGWPVAWDDVPGKVAQLRDEHGLDVEFELFLNRRSVLSDKQIECFF
jgi:hypothetical protein